MPPGSRLDLSLRDHEDRAVTLRVVVAVCALVMVGCSGSDDEATYGSQAVAASLAMHGLDVEVVFDRAMGEPPDGTVLGLLDLFDDVDDVGALVADTADDRAIGREVSAWIFDSADHAESSSRVRCSGSRSRTSLS